MSLTKEEKKQIRDILKWWTEKSVENNPRFKHDNPRIAAVRLSSAMYEDALQLARSKGNYRTFSHMMEMLLWEALGLDSKYIKEPTVNDNQQESLELSSEKEDNE